MACSEQYSGFLAFLREPSENVAVARLRRIHGGRGGEAPGRDPDDRSQGACGTGAAHSPNHAGGADRRGPIERGSAPDPKRARRRNAPLGSLLSGDVQEGEDATRSAEETNPAIDASRMRLSREKIVRLSHAVTDLLVASEDVEFIEDRDTIRQQIMQILQTVLKEEEQV